MAETKAGAGSDLSTRAKNILTMQLAGANFSYYMANAAAVGYLAVYLNSQGYSTAQVGTIAAINSALGIFAAPLWGVLADRWRSVVKVIILTAIVGSLLYGAVPLFESLHIGFLPVIFILIPIGFFFRMPVMTLAQSYELEKCDRHGINFGLLRGMGSLAFALGSIVLSFVVPKTGPGIAFYVTAVLALPTILIFWRVDRGEKPAQQQSMSFKDMRFGELFRNWRLMSFLVLSAFTCVVLWCNSTFWPKLLESIGEDGARVGLVNGTKAFVEIPFMIVIPFLKKRFKLENILIFAFVLFTLESLVYVFAQSFWQILLSAIVFDGAGAGLFYAASATYVFSLAPERLNSTAQAMLGAIGSVTGVIGSLLGGFITDAFGVQAFYLAVTIAAAISVVLFAVITIVSRKATA